MVKRDIIGLTEEVEIKGKKVIARIDSGARRCSIDKKLAKKLKLGPIIAEGSFRSAAGRTKRPVVEEEIRINNVTLKVLINLSDRSKMKYKMLIGREGLRKGNFLIDPLR
ncbi:MAG: RimK/LysX family protein [Nanoarchaeota archaeon]|nr:RimK/LysX family protein [Nanoarchaeota archaeon]